MIVCQYREASKFRARTLTDTTVDEHQVSIEIGHLPSPQSRKELEVSGQAYTTVGVQSQYPLDQFQVNPPPPQSKHSSGTLSPPFSQHLSPQPTIHFSSISCHGLPGPFFMITLYVFPTHSTLMNRHSTPAFLDACDGAQKGVPFMLLTFFFLEQRNNKPPSSRLTHTFRRVGYSPWP